MNQKMFFIGFIACLISIISLCLAGTIWEKMVNQVLSSSNYEIYQQAPKVDSLKFANFDEATEVIIIPPVDLNLTPIVIKNTQEVKLVAAFIQRYPDGWVAFHYTKSNLLEITAAPSIDFYNNEGNLLGYYKIRSDIIVYKDDNQIYWRYVGVEQLKPIIEMLSIPDELLFYP